MGREAQCTAHLGDKTSRGKALLESDRLIFRGEFRFSVLFSKMRSVKADGGELRFIAPEGAVRLALGPAAATWADKILHPPSRLDKLGVKPGMRVFVLGRADSDFLEELGACVSSPAQELNAARDLIFYFVAAKSELSRARQLARSIQSVGALWIVYPKGRKDITENDVLSAGKAAGLVDVKVVSFSPTHTALKFVIPVSRR